MAATILCADDDRHYCQILSRAFQQEGYKVETAFDGDEALEKLRSIRPQLVTLDVMLPKRDGFQVLESIRGSEDELRQVPVLLVSGCSITADYQKRADELAANGVLQKPVPLDRLLGVVADHVNKGAAARVPAAAGSVALNGTLEELPLAPLMQQLHGLRATGVLQVQHGKKRKQVQFRDGAPMAVRSNLVQETLGHLLLASGKITKDVLHDSLLRVKRGDGLHGQILKAMHMLDEADLAAALHAQAEEKLLEMFGWKKGRFRFHRDARLKSANTLTLKRSAASLVWRGVAERVPMDTVDHFLESHAERAPVPGESAFYNYQDVELGDETNEWVARFDGSKTLNALAPLPEESRRRLYGLIVLGMVELREAAPAPKEKFLHKVRAAPSRRIRELHRNVQSGEERATDRQEEDERRELTRMAERMRDQDHFAVLGVARTATDEDVRSAYAVLAKQTHPDRYTGASDVLARLAEEVFGTIALAYEEIAEREKRNKYLRKQQGRDAEQRELEIGQRAVQAELEFQKGEVALRAGQVAVALPHFEKAAEIYPEEGEYVAYMGWTWYLAEPDAPKRLQRALAIVQKGRQLAPDREKPYLFLGRLCKANGRMDAAEKMFMRAVQLDPDSVEALRELRLIDMRREKSKGFVSKLLRR